MESWNRECEQNCSGHADGKGGQGINAVGQFDKLGQRPPWRRFLKVLCAAVFHRRFVTAFLCGGAEQLVVQNKRRLLSAQNSRCGL
jgi:hypothetical protein